MKFDKSHWISLKPPLSPGDEDVEIFSSLLLDGSTLLLGCTPKLLSLVDQAIDIDPHVDDEKICIGDWSQNNKHYSNIIIDGGLNLNESLCDDVLMMSSRCCDRLIARVFNRKLTGMRYATYFPSQSEFLFFPVISIIDIDYSFYIWNFDDDS